MEFEQLTLTSEKVFLRPSTPADHPALKDLLNDQKTMAILKAYFKVETWTDELIAARYENYRNKQKLRELLDFVVIDRATDQLIGNCGFNHLEFEKRTSDFGIILHHSVWGKGISSECHRLCLDYGFQNLNFKSVSFVTDEANLRMQGFFTKVGIPLLSTNVKEKTRRYEVKRDSWPEVRSKLI
ncbi:GNAT family N-acetyltransferase [bacterium]|jgi:ribosomal-protein-alanine N-acetyltransferase|nr:GNAT family N-acetyltransferase [bacterium]